MFTRNGEEILINAKQYCFMNGWMKDNQLTAIAREAFKLSLRERK